MAIAKCVVYKGEKFHLQSTGRYYQSGRKEAGERLLHRRIWIEANGEIPDGYQVHHIDGDWSNNALENLRLVEREAHNRQHMIERIAADTTGFYKRAQTKAVAAAVKWHKSPEGRAWHAKHAKDLWVGRKLHSIKCSVCGGTFETPFPSRTRFCSRACEQREGYLRHKDKQGVCALCGRTFVCNRYAAQRCCSRLCGNRLRAQTAH